jgi:hypothetical protein
LRRETGNRQYDRFEAASVTRLILGHDDELWATRLGFPAALTKADPFGPGSGRRGDHLVSCDDHSGAI